jgi:hypothetical protein
MAILALLVASRAVHRSTTMRVGERIDAAMAVAASGVFEDRHHLSEFLDRFHLLCE